MEMATGGGARRHAERTQPGEKQDAHRTGKTAIVTGSTAGAISALQKDAPHWSRPNRRRTSPPLSATTGAVLWVAEASSLPVVACPHAQNRPGDANDGSPQAGRPINRRRRAMLESRTSRPPHPYPSADRGHRSTGIGTPGAGVRSPRGRWQLLYGRTPGSCTLDDMRRAMSSAARSPALGSAGCLRRRHLLVRR